MTSLNSFKFKPQTKMQREERTSIGENLKPQRMYSIVFVYCLNVYTPEQRKLSILIRNNSMLLQNEKLLKSPKGPTNKNVMSPVNFSLSLYKIIAMISNLENNINIIL